MEKFFGKISKASMGRKLERKKKPVVLEFHSKRRVLCETEDEYIVIERRLTITYTSGKATASF